MSRVMTMSVFARLFIREIRRYFMALHKMLIFYR